MGALDCILILALNSFVDQVLLQELLMSGLSLLLQDLAQFSLSVGNLEYTDRSL